MKATTVSEKKVVARATMITSLTILSPSWMEQSSKSNASIMPAIPKTVSGEMHVKKTSLRNSHPRNLTSGFRTSDGIT
jgi:hypothetical protein